MIRDTHLQTLRELVEQARRDLAGYERILDRAQQEARVGMTFPDPLTAPAPMTGQWGAPMPTEWNIPVPPPAEPRPWVVDDQPVTPPVANGGGHRVTPYTANFDGTLPQEKETVLGDFHAEHQADAATPKAAKEQQKWEQA